MKDGVKEIYYESKLVENLGKNVSLLSNLILVLGILLLAVAAILIHNTIKLALYSNRLLIKTMELTGASWSFITRPFILRAIANATISAIIAILMVGGSLYIIFYKLIQSPINLELNMLALIGLIIFSAGIGINIFSTYFTVNKYLKLRWDELHS